MAATICASVPVSYGPVANDYARYIPEHASPRSTFWSAFGGMFIGCWVAIVIGAFATSAFIHPDAGGDFVSGLMASSPMWFVIFLIYAGIFGNVANGALALYNATLDLHAITWRLRRVSVAFIVGGVALAGTILGTVVWDGVATLEALLSIMIVTVAPWMLINAIGHWHCGGSYKALDLHAFTWAPGSGKGAYWYTAGLEPRAFCAWIVAIAVGLLFISTTLITGPVVKHVGGVDFSFIASLIVGGVLYEVLLRLAPVRRAEPAVAAEPEPVTTAA
jgi:purine-cytosine permease-like protein